MINKPVFSRISTIALVILTSTLSACASQATEKEPALLPVHSEQARAEIVTLVSQSFGGKNIAIAENVFQETSRLLIGKASISSPKGVSGIRADQETAIVFELVKQGENCLLRRLNTTQEWQLTTKACFIAS